MFARSLLLLLGSMGAASAFVTPVGNSPVSLARSQLRTSAVSARRPAVSALRMQQSPIKLTPQLFTELDTDGSGTISAAEVEFSKQKQSMFSLLPGCMTT
jgi:hypothetical protein